MAVKRVKIVPPNGKVGYVPETYPPLVAGRVKLAPSERDRQAGPRDGNDAGNEAAETQGVVVRGNTITPEKRQPGSEPR